MQLDVSAPAVVGGEVEDDVHAVHDLPGEAVHLEVATDELDAPVVDVVLDVLELAAGQVIHHAHRGAALDEPVHQMRADERGATGHQHRPILPVHWDSPFTSPAWAAWMRPWRHSALAPS